MKQEDEEYYQELFEMFSTPGWRHYQDYLLNIKETAQKNWGLSGDDLLTNKGVVYNATELLGFQGAHEDAYNSLQQEKEDAW